MNHNSRTKNSIINSIYALSSQIITILLSFVIRTVFIKTLSAEYLGINGLFSNIITMLSLTDLGIGLAIPYTLYKPLAEDNKPRIQVLMKLYAKIYNIIGLVVLILGIAITPFLKYIVSEMPDIPEINLIYIMFVVNSACSYFFVYKKILLTSDQKAYIANRITMFVTVAKSVIEIAILCIYRNYILYLSISIITTITENIIISMKCDKLYPYLKEKTKDSVSKKDIQKLRKNTSASMIYRLATVIMTGTDSIIISKFIGVIAVGIYSNYVLITNSISKIISQIFSAITSSIGNLIVTTNEDRSEEILHKLQFLNFWLHTFFSLCVIALINPFIRLWVGEEYLLDNYVAFVIGLNLYVLGMQNVVTSFKDAYGLFVQGRYRPVIMTIVNIILSVWWGQIFGILGVILATAFSRLFILGIYDPIVLYKYGFKKRSRKYFCEYIKYFIVFIILSIIFLYIISKINIQSIVMWIIIACIVAILVNIILIILFHKDENFKFYKEKLLDIIKNKIRKG